MHRHPARDPIKATQPHRQSNSHSASSLDPHRYRDLALGIFALVLAFRIVNALTLRTFFQPDEFFQSLEPAWQLVFGRESNAWITWEWRNQLRSSLHPDIFAAVYLVAAKLSQLCGLNLPSQAELYIAAPKVTQAVFAALLDFHTWKLAEQTYGRASRTAYATLALSLCSPWQWFCSTRTLSNCLETTLTSIAVCHWPWQWLHPRPTAERSQNAVQSNIGSLLRLYYEAWTFPPLRFLYFNIAQSLAVFYGKNRPDYYLTEGLPLLLTTALPFALVGTWKALRGQISSDEEQTHTDGRHALVSSTPETEQHASTSPTKSDSSSPAAVVKPSTATTSSPKRPILQVLAYTSVTLTLTLSLISHKEVRFLYPILPFLHVLAAEPLTNFFLSSASSATTTSPSPLLTPSLPRKLLLLTLLTANLSLSYYTSQVHQRGVISVLTYLRTSHEHALSPSPSPSPQSPSTSPTTSVAFLTPCHSTPWRSHLIHASLTAWALTCEPPLSIPPGPLRSAYLDEADVFYADPAAWLRDNMQHVSRVRARRGSSRTAGHWVGVEDAARRGEGTREWPSRLVFFGGLEGVLRGFIEGNGMEDEGEEVEGGRKGAGRVGFVELILDLWQ
ncbi:glycosyltransferase family 22 protein [Aaosphaeria arxii CBS 175.79]|uniref:Mannosyltransferase n=1 Tax=Aaosphaeria arxii CBS 175.79 TaxID=1450172 RepID=A0A6A5XZJ8_9PLEO|nr:glycosyltransferase family 22 protein [Aaosphaeria arxii CBS 175.79]KAF2018151.1 glycosyltransferase family 22 protein [Aaosphaeria arxii CBS 175.79]